MTQTAATQLTELRMLMRETIYNNDQYINLLLNYIEQLFDCTSINFDKNNMKIDIKIKKTIMKKAEDYSHNVMYYYPLICQSLMSFLNDTSIRNEITNATDYVKYELIRSNILPLFNATVLLDNIVVIQL